MRVLILSCNTGEGHNSCGRAIQEAFRGQGIDCEMVDTDLAFERSEVEATVTTPVLSIKNPLSGRITVPAVGEIIRDIPQARGEVLVTQTGGPACA